MYPSSNGKMFFDDPKKMFYNLFLEIGLSVNNEQFIYDQDSGIVLKYKDKRIKMSFTNNVYASNNDVVFDPVTNYDLMAKLFGYYIEKETVNGNDIGYIAHFTDADEESGKVFVPKDTKFKQRLVVKTKNGDIITQSYYNIYLAYIEAIFIISGNDEYDLSNFDILPEI